MYNIYETYQMFFLRMPCSDRLGRFRGSERGIFLKKFQNMVMLHNYQIKGTYACSNMEAYVLPVYTPSTPELGSKGQLIYFISESNRVAYQVEGNGVYSNI